MTFIILMRKNALQMLLLLCIAAIQSTNSQTDTTTEDSYETTTETDFLTQDNKTRQNRRNIGLDDVTMEDEDHLLSFEVPNSGTDGKLESASKIVSNEENEIKPNKTKTVHPVENLDRSVVDLILKNKVKKSDYKNHVRYDEVTGEAVTDEHPCARECKEGEEPMICYYHFNLEWYQTMSKACYDCPFVEEDCERQDCIPADGMSRSINVINRKMPGPAVEVCQHDRIIVDVENDLMTEGTTVHWHGQHQRGSPYMDGTPFVTQCPIPPETTFRYQFNASNTGTHFWHSHSGMQRADGAAGALIIRKPVSLEPHGGLYDYDRSEHVMIVTDWIHELAVSMFTDHHHSRGDNKPPTLLINGVGRFAIFNTTTKEKYMRAARFNVEQGYKYRFRVINAEFLNCPIEMSVDGHNITVIASDGHDLEPITGNVYIYHAGRWGAICDDSWDDAAAKVVCGRYNLSGVATRGSQFGPATVKFWMDDVVCEGDETSLPNCKFSGWGSSDCKPSEAAGVVCSNSSRPSSDVRRRPLKEVLKRLRVRLVGGRSRSEGRIEIYHKGSWGSICPDGWTIFEALTVCRHFNLGFARQALQTDAFGTSRVVLNGVECAGNETDFVDCLHLDRDGCPGRPGQVAAVTCTHNLADLFLDHTTLESSAHLQDVMMYQLQCAMEENCLAKSAYEIQRTNPDWQYETRRLLRFTAASLNIGNEDFRPYLPKHLWQWHLCHMHYHSMEVFATFDVLDSSGQRVAEGHKASFCLEDNTCLSGVEKKYSCKNYGDQGVSVNCSDVYKYNIDCQWVDVTDVRPGDYTFKVSVNPHARVAEQSYHNNAAVCQLRLTDTFAVVHDCVLGRP